MKKKRSSADNILKDLEFIYRMSIANKNFATALKAKELLGRQFGFISLKKRDKVSLADFSEEDIKRLIEELKRELALDHSETGA